MMSPYLLFILLIFNLERKFLITYQEPSINEQAIIIIFLVSIAISHKKNLEHLGHVAYSRPSSPKNWASQGFYPQLSQSIQSDIIQ
jgi:hypothetical protein